MVSAVRKEEVRVAPQPRPHNHIQPKPEDRTDAIIQARGRLATGLIMSVTILLMFATVGRYAELSDKQIAINTLQKKITEAQAVNQQLSVAVSTGQDIGSIEAYARANLDMEYGERASVTYVTLPEERPPTEYAQEQQEKGLFAMLTQLLD